METSLAGSQFPINHLISHKSCPKRVAPYELAPKFGQFGWFWPKHKFPFWGQRLSLGDELPSHTHRLVFQLNPPQYLDHLLFIFLTFSFCHNLHLCNNPPYFYVSLFVCFLYNSIRNQMHFKLLRASHLILLEINWKQKTLKLDIPSLLMFYDPPIITI